MTPREKAARTAAAIYAAANGPASVWDPLVDALERVELLELELAAAAVRLGDERAHVVTSAATALGVVRAARGLRRYGVSPETWSALRRALVAHDGQTDLFGSEEGTPIA